MKCFIVQVMDKDSLEVFNVDTERKQMLEWVGKNLGTLSPENKEKAGLIMDGRFDEVFNSRGGLRSATLRSSQGVVHIFLGTFGVPA